MSTFRLQRGEPLLDIASYARRGPGRTDRLSPAQIEHIARTVRRVPEVMIKVSGGGTSCGAVAAHFNYIDRRGELDIETDDGDRRHGKTVAMDLVESWGLDAAAAEAKSPYSGRPGQKPGKLVHNIILSMPAGTPPAMLLAASRAFAREQFALKHRYAMVLHTDQDHPHVHLVVKTLSTLGERLNIRKATLREWRQEFARHLREQGIAANATERAVRGVARTRKSDGIYRAMLRGESAHIRNRVATVASALSKGKIQIERGNAKLLGTRKNVERGWRAVSDILVGQGHQELAVQVNRFAEKLPLPKTENEQLETQLLVHARLRRIERGTTVR